MFIFAKYIGLFFVGDLKDGTDVTIVATGLMVERAGRNNDVVKLMPTLLVDDETLKKGLQILVDAVKKVIEEIIKILQKNKKCDNIET